MKKNFKLVLALVLALMLVMGMTSAMAASITITRDSSYTTDGVDNGAGRTYEYYKVFSASYASNTSTGGGQTNGAPGAVTGSAASASYTATSTVAGILGSWVDAVAADPEAQPPVEAAAAHWQRASGNEWFDLTPIAGSTNFSVTWVGANTADRVQAAAAWLIANNAYEAGPTALTFSNGSWTSGTIDPGYYLIKGDTGNNLVAATSDINIAEKNNYPDIDKTQADEDNTTQNDSERDVAVGDVLTYNVKVTIPATAKAGDIIQVYDKATQGLTFNNNVTVSPETAASATSDATAETGDTWRKNITLTADNVASLKGVEVTFAFTMTVNSNALVDTGKENEAGIKYGTSNGWTYESKPDKVEYKTYYAGIHKYDGTTNENLAGVKFALKEAGVAFNVTKSGNVYIPGGSSNEVVTDSNGKIIIRGLDENKTYTLTETYALPGYNPLDHDVTLTLHLDSATVVDENGTETTTYSYNETTATTDATWGDQVANNKGSLLPSTGGMGTTIFYIGGSVLVLAAAILLITKRRMSSND